MVVAGRCRFVCSAVISILILSESNAKILRHGKHFDAAFTVVSSNHKLKSQFVISTHPVTDLHKCVKECVYEKRCESFNYNDGRKICEILNASSSAVEHRLRYVNGWTHYETDPGAKKIGPYCSTVSPCNDTHVCEDTYNATRYSCRCQQDFSGDNCDFYNGPGNKSSSPAASCLLLSRIYRSLKNGFYWFKRKENSVKLLYCNVRQSNELGKTPDAAIRSCEWLSRKYPDMKSGYFWSWNEIGDALEMRYCNFELETIDFQTTLENLYNDVKLTLSTTPSMAISKGNLVATIEKLRKEYIIEFDVQMQQASDSFTNLLRFTTGSTMDMSYSEPPFVALQNGAIKICADLYGTMTVTCLTFNDYVTQNWISIRIAQVKYNHEYIFVVHVNGGIVDVARKVKAKEIYGVNVYASSPIGESINGDIRKFNLYGDHSIWDGNELLLINESRRIAHNTLLATLGELRVEYKITFDVKVMIQSSKKNVNILDFRSINGRKIISFFINAEGKLTVKFRDQNLIFHSFPENEWKTVEVSQIKDGEIFLYIISVQGVQLHHEKIMDPVVYKDVMIYGSNEKDSPLNGDIRQLAIYGNHIYWKGNRSHLIVFPKNVTKNNLVKTLNKMGKEFKVRFGMKIIRSTNAWANVIHFTTGGSRGHHGNRYPAVFHLSNWIRVYTSLNDDSEYKYENKDYFSLGKWINFDISQIKEGNKFVFAIKINSDKVHNVTNTSPREFQYMKIYAMDNWHENNPSLIRNFEIYGDFE